MNKEQLRRQICKLAEQQLTVSGGFKGGKWGNRPQETKETKLGTSSFGEKCAPCRDLKTHFCSFRSEFGLSP